MKTTPEISIGEEQTVTRELSGSPQEETAGFARAETALDSPIVFAPSTVEGDLGRLGKYRVLKELGRGGMGAVFLAFDERLQRKVALKVMLPKAAANARAKDRFLREARAAAKISSDYVVNIFEADEIDGIPFIALQYLQGSPLDEYIKKKGLPNTGQLIRIGRETALGLAAAHKLGLVHRDIKPGNLWLEAPNGRVKILDFGLAKPVVGADVAELTGSGAVLGTPSYMAPEQGMGQPVDGRSDLFSLGCVLYRLCTGKLPFEGPTVMAILTALATQEPTPVLELNKSIPEGLANLIGRLLAKKPSDRPADAEAVAEELHGITAWPAAKGEGTAPKVVYVPMQMTAVPSETVRSPFADIHEPDSISEAIPKTAPKKKIPTSSWLWIAAGLAMVFLTLAAGVIIIIKNKDGSITKIEVPDGATVEVKKDDKPAETKPAETKPAPKPASNDPDRKAAEWVLSVGGAVQVSVNGQAVREFRGSADLTKERVALTWVSLGGPKVTDAGLANFKGCTSLTWLDLGNSPVTDAGLANFKDCKGLTHLNLGGNSAVTDAGLAHFKDCKGLKRLDLLNVPVTDAGLAHFKDSKELTYLNLDGTKATDIGLAHFEDCKGLTYLGLTGTGVTNKGLALFKDCKLTELSLNGARPVTDEGLAHFKDCKLTVLKMGDTSVTDAGLVHFKGSTGLKFLHLFGTKTTDAGLAHFKDCKGLVRLELNGVPVTDAGLAPFHNCKGLTLLDARHTKLTAKGLADFHAAVPGCTIDHDGGKIEPKVAADPGR